MIAPEQRRKHAGTVDTVVVAEDQRLVVDPVDDNGDNHSSDPSLGSRNDGCALATIVNIAPDQELVSDSPMLTAAPHPERTTAATPASAAGQIVTETTRGFLQLHSASPRSSVPSSIRSSTNSAHHDPRFQAGHREDPTRPRRLAESLTARPRGRRGASSRVARGTRRGSESSGGPFDQPGQRRQQVGVQARLRLVEHLSAGTRRQQRRDEQQVAQRAVRQLGAASGRSMPG